MTSIFNTSRECPRMHVCCIFGDSSPNPWRVIARTSKVYGRRDRRTDTGNDSTPSAWKARGKNHVKIYWWCILDNYYGSYRGLSLVNYASRNHYPECSNVLRCNINHLVIPQKRNPAVNTTITIADIKRALDAPTNEICSLNIPQLHLQRHTTVAPVTKWINNLTTPAWISNHVTSKVYSVDVWEWIRNSSHAI